jgi:hypothetical protein
MSAEHGCAEFRELAPELALGIADGQERARALEHLSGCADCRRYLDELSTTADELLLLAPEQEPPLGFESRVANAISPAPRTRRWWRRPVALAATATTAAAIGAGAMVLVYRDDHHLASMYRATLSEANGSYFTASPLQAPGGTTVGQAFGYQGDPSWVLVTVAAPSGRLPDGRYKCELVGADGNRVGFGSVDLVDGQGSYGHSIATSLDDVSEIRLLGPGRGTVLEAHPGSS